MNTINNCSVQRTLTRRQTEVVRLVAEDLPSREIASRLGISVKTVEFHRASIYERIGVKGPAGMVRYAIKTGVIDA